MLLTTFSRGIVKKQSSNEDHIVNSFNVQDKPHELPYRDCHHFQNK